MTIRPIIFRDFEVRALLEGRKTQTRRVLKVRKGLTIGDMLDGGERDGNAIRAARDQVEEPKIAPGDLLWAREGWKPGAWREDGRVAVDYRASPEETQTPWITLPDNTDWDDLEWRWSEEARKADCPMDDCGYYHWEPGQSPFRWRSPALMPRWASRLTLRVTDVRVQRVQEISEEDAVAEGVERDPASGGYWGADGSGLDGATSRYSSARLAFRDLWNTLHKPPHDWDGNPWVAAISFDLIRKNVGDVEE